MGKATRPQGNESTSRRTVVLAGIDEAGYGPLLGPLVIGCAVFQVPISSGDGAGDRLPNLWTLLDPVVGKDPRDDDARHRVLVCDSKRLHSTTTLRPLEETVLTFSAAQSIALGGGGKPSREIAAATESVNTCNVFDAEPGHSPPRDLFDPDLAAKRVAQAPGARATDPQPKPLPGRFAAFLHRHSLLVPDDANDAEWFSTTALEALPLPRAAVDAKCLGRAERLAERMRSVGVGLLGVRVRPVPVPEFNVEVTRCGNKGAAHLHWILQVVAQLWRRYPDAVVVLDRLGGRQRYGPALERAFPAATIASSREGPSGADGELQFARYELVAPRQPHDPPGVDERRLALAFLQEAEDQSLPVALASCFAKYTRECYVELLNAYFQRVVAPTELKPTKGYYQDGRRFLADLRAAGVDVDRLSQQLIRQR